MLLRCRKYLASTQTGQFNVAHAAFVSGAAEMFAQTKNWELAAGNIP